MVHDDDYDAELRRIHEEAGALVLAAWLGTLLVVALFLVGVWWSL